MADAARFSLLGLNLLQATAHVPLGCGEGAPALTESQTRALGGME